MRGKAGRVPDRIQDILEAIRNIREDIGSQSKKAFLADGKTQRAVIESLIVIGEAANSVLRLDTGIENTHPALWLQLRDAYDMRIVLTHEYFRVDAAVVWDTVQTDLPRLASHLETLQ